MTLDEFKKLCKKEIFPVGMSQLLKALWYDARGDWDTAHRIVQDISEPAGSWIHAYLHRQEGDLANAAYWYGQAGKHKSDISLHKEWEQIVSAILYKSLK